MSQQLDGILTTVGERASPLSEILEDTESFLKRFVAYPSESARIAHVLWIAHTHAMDEWDSTPRIVFASPEPESGKTRALEITETLVPRPIESVNATPAYLFRKVSDEDGLPTVLYDEIDTVFGPKAKDNEEVRGFLNAGHRRGAMAGRCVTSGKTIRTEELPAYCAVAMAGLGNLPDTILTRSVVIQMRRRAPNERLEPYRRRIHSPDGNLIRNRLADWADSFRLDGNYPTMPDGVEDRAADVWEPLLAVAEAAGEMWTKRAHVASVALIEAGRDTSPSLGLRLLDDLRTVFGYGKQSKTEPIAQLKTETILEKLCSMDEAPWGDLRGKPLNPRGLARYLKPHGVKSHNLSIGDSRPKGYKAEDLWDTWNRYLPPISQDCATSALGATSQAATDLKVASVAQVAHLREGPKSHPDDVHQGGQVNGQGGQDSGTGVSGQVDATTEKSLIDIRLSDSTYYNAPLEFIEDLKSQFPNVDIDRALSDCAAWHGMNPDGREPERDIKRHILLGIKNRDDGVPMWQ